MSGQFLERRVLLLDAFPGHDERGIARGSHDRAVSSAQIHLYPIIEKVLEILLRFLDAAFGSPVAKRNPSILNRYAGQLNVPAVEVGTRSTKDLRETVRIGSLLRILPVAAGFRVELPDIFRRVT